MSRLPAVTASSPLPANIRRDIETVTAMVDIYCRDQHQTRGGLCASCAELLAYSHQRLGKCPYGDQKTTCRECPIHCYRPAERAAMRDVMRYAGPRMLRRHPLLAIRHLWIERRGAPKRPGGRDEPPGRKRRRCRGGQSRAPDHSGGVAGRGWRW